MEIIHFSGTHLTDRQHVLQAIHETVNTLLGRGVTYRRADNTVSGADLIIAYLFLECCRNFEGRSRAINDRILTGGFRCPAILVKSRVKRKARALGGQPSWTVH